MTISLGKLRLTTIIIIRSIAYSVIVYMLLLLLHCYIFGYSKEAMIVITNITLSLLGIVAIFSIPWISDEIQKSEAKQSRREELFRKILAARGTTRLQEEYVCTLNQIDAEYWDIDDKKDRPVIEAWREYCEHLNKNPVLFCLNELEKVCRYSINDHEKLFTDNDIWYDINDLRSDESRGKAYSKLEICTYDEFMDLVIRTIGVKEIINIVKEQDAIKAHNEIGAIINSYEGNGKDIAEGILKSLWKKKDIILYSRFIYELAQNIGYKYPNDYLDDKYYYPPSLKRKHEKDNT